MNQNSSLVGSHGSDVAGLWGSLLVLLVGCGDMDPGHIPPKEVPPDHACFDGSTIELVRYSSSCEKASKSLAGEVHDGTVFSADDVRALESPCEPGPNPAIELSFDTEHHSLFFDFSQVSHTDRFPEAEFEGYIIDVVLREENGLLVGVKIDEEASNLDLDHNDVAWNHSHIEVNFEGARYDRHSVLKLYLFFARVPPISE